MSDARPHDADSEVEALTDQDEVHEGASPEDERPAAAPTLDSGVDGDREVDLGDGAPESQGDDVEPTDDTGQPVEDAGTGDPSSEAELDAPD